MAVNCLGLQARGQEQAGAKTFFLPQNPVAAAYVLGRLSNAELIAAPRSESVYVALLERKGLDKKYRLEALEGLSKVRHTTAPAEIVKAVARLDKKGEESEPVLRDLTPILLQSRPQELSGLRDSWTALASESQLALTRQIAYAARVTADGSPDPAWQEVKSQAARVVDLVSAIPLIQQAGLRGEFYGRIEPLVEGATAPELRQAAMLALVSIPGHDAQNFHTLAGLLQAGTERETAVAALVHIPQAAWSKELTGGMATNLVHYLEGMPTVDRTSPSFANALQLATEVSSTLPEPASRALLETLRGLGPTIVLLHAIYEQMRFDKQLIVVERGKPVVLSLQNDDAMPHNVAILAPGSLEEIGQAAEKMSAEPDARGRLYVPVSSKLLYATKMIAPGQKGQLAFTAPGEVGDYPYTCTFPGHWRRMTGILAVTDDPAAYLASHAQGPAPAITEWKLADLAPELSQAFAGSRVPENGRDFFTRLACVQCHRLGQQGYSFGPDLTEVFTRYKNDRAGVLQQILEPSAKIDDRYRNYTFELKDGDSVLGLVLKEDADTVTIQTGPADSLIQVLKKSEILSRRPQASSPMPVGLLNALSKDQIFDLLAYLESGGKVPAHQHAH